jgi:hypothetical protein
MTTVVILLLGLGAVLITSSIESTPNGSDVSLLQTISDIWNDQVNVQQGNTPSTSFTASTLPSGQQPAVGTALSTVANNTTGPAGGTNYL